MNSISEAKGSESVINQGAEMNMLIVVKRDHRMIIVSGQTVWW